MNKLIPRLAAVAIACYFLYFAIPALRALFAIDDMENMYHYWSRGTFGNLWDDVRFWSTAYRPMGGLFYMPLYHAFGMNPLPFRIGILLILAVNTFLSYRVAALITESKPAAILTTVLVCAQANMIALYYANSYIYDLLAYFFTVLMLYCYLRFRSHGVLIACLYIAALDSKEIAVVGAGWVLAYEILVQRPRNLRLPLVLMGIGLLYAAGKNLGSNPLIHVEGYTMQFSIRRYVMNNTLYLNDIWYSNFFDSGWKLLFIWALIALLCWEFGKPKLWWCWFAALTSTLPISFLRVARGGPSLYLPFLVFALTASMLIAGIVKRPALQWAVAGVLACAFAWQTADYWRDRIQPSLDAQKLTWHVLDQVRAVNPRPKPNSKVIFLNNPFADWDPYFIGALVWNDHTLQLNLAEKLPAPPDLKAYDLVVALK